MIFYISPGFFGNNLTAFPQEEESENVDIEYPSTEITREEYILPGKPPKQKPKPSVKKARQVPIQDTLDFLDEFAALQEELMGKYKVENKSLNV